MGSITSGYEGWRGGKAALEALPEARLTHKETFSIKPINRPKIYTECDDLVKITYGLREWYVLTETSPCHFGRERRWLICGACHCKRVALYIVEDKIACRTCLNLRYNSQHETTRDRAYRRVDSIRKKLQWSPGVANPRGPKPPRMHRTTFKRLVAEHDALASYLFGNLQNWIERAEKRLKKKLNGTQ